MWNKSYIKILLGCTVFGWLIAGCQKSELVGYTGGSTVGFWVHTINHSLYGMTVEELPRDTVTLDLAITGDVVDYDRYVEGTFIPDAPGTAPDEQNNTAVEGVDYNILGGIVKANEEYGKFQVEIINRDFLKENELKLNLAIKASKDFEVGLKDNNSIIISWSQKVMPPATWNMMRYFFCATYSTQVYKVFMQVTGLKEFDYPKTITETEGFVMGRNFGNAVRAYEEQYKTPMLHDDGDAEGTPIIPLY